MKKQQVNILGLILFALLVGQTYCIYDLQQKMVQITTNSRPESNVYNRQPTPARKLFRYRDLGPILKNVAYTKHNVTRGLPPPVHMPSIKS